MIEDAANWWSVCELQDQAGDDGRTAPPAAQGVADKLVQAGVKAILNYAPTVLSVPSSVHVQHIDPSTHLQRMTFYLD